MSFKIGKSYQRAALAAALCASVSCFVAGCSNSQPATTETDRQSFVGDPAKKAQESDKARAAFAAQKQTVNAGPANGGAPPAGAKTP